jgi:hypothetical protein
LENITIASNPRVLAALRWQLVYVSLQSHMYFAGKGFMQIQEPSKVQSRKPGGFEVKIDLLFPAIPIYILQEMGLCRQTLKVPSRKPRAFLFNIFEMSA